MILVRITDKTVGADLKAAIDTKETRLFGWMHRARIALHRSRFWRPVGQNRRVVHLDDAMKGDEFDMKVFVRFAEIFLAIQATRDCTRARLWWLACVAKIGSICNSE